MELSDFDYELDKELIAHEPAPHRSESRLLVASGGKVEHKKFSDIIDYLEPGDVLVVNESKVLTAQIDAFKETGGKVSVMVSKKLDKGYLCKINGHRVREGSVILFPEGIRATVLSISIKDFILDFGSASVEEMLSKHGRVPLPPYIKGTPPDLSRYQTVYAGTPGSLAAPTAGLHFSDSLIDKIKKKGVKFAKLTLHVSFGTFNPIKVDDVTKHKMDPEYYTVTQEAADVINNRKGRLIVVGTTSLKTLESSADINGKIVPGSAWSELFIYPGYKFKCAIDALVTNFHLPKSTLLLLVSAFFGRERILELYKEAVEQRYRFFSFGDAMLLSNIRIPPFS